MRNPALRLHHHCSRLPCVPESPSPVLPSARGRACREGGTGAPGGWAQQLEDRPKGVLSHSETSHSDKKQVLLRSNVPFSQTLPTSGCLGRQT